MRIENGSMVTGSVQLPLLQGRDDAYSKNIQKQIADAEKKMQELGDKEELSLEEKMKKRQELRQQISDLQNQLRQHQIEQRKEARQKKGSSMEDMLGGNVQERKYKNNSGMSSAGMQALIAADGSMKQAQVQGAVKSQMDGKAGVLKAEIMQDEARGGDASEKREELAETEAKAAQIEGSTINTLSSINNDLKKANEEDQKNNRTEMEGKEQMAEEESGKKELSEHKGEYIPIDIVSSGITLDNATEDPVGNNVDALL